MATKTSETILDGDDKRLRNTVQSLAKGFRVLEAFSSEQEEMTLSQIAQAAELDPGTTFRMLNTLVDLGYVARLPESRRFSLTLRVLDLGFHAIARRDLRSLVRPILKGLVSETQEAASFAVLNGVDVLYIERVRAGITRLGVDIRIGTTVPATQTAIGQSMLAFLPPAELQKIEAQNRDSAPAWQPAQQPTDLAERLAGIRAQGYALSPSLFTEGLLILAVPVLDTERYPIGAISIAAPMVRCSAEDLRERALDMASAAARQIAGAVAASGSIGFTL